MAPIVHHPDVQRNLLTMKALTQAARALAYSCAHAIDMARVSEGADKAHWQDRANLLTPLAKAFSTDVGVDVASLGVQIHGGMGFIEETGAAALLRDARIAPIYEGTNGIQAIDLVTRKLGLADGEVVTELLAQIAMLDPALIRAGEPFATIRVNLAEALTLLADTTNWVMRNGVGDPRNALAGATPYLRMFSLVVAGWLMARSAIAARAELAAGNGDAEQLQAKVATARFFCEQILPQVKGLEAPILAGFADLYAVPDSQF